MYAANIFISKAIRTTREMITKRISGQQKQPGSFILQAEPLSRSYHVAESICRIYNTPPFKAQYFGVYGMQQFINKIVTVKQFIECSIFHPLIPTTELSVYHHSFSLQIKQATLIILWFLIKLIIL